MDDQNHQSDRRYDEPQFDDDHVDDATPDRVVAEMDDDRQREGQGDDHGCEFVEHRTEH